MDMKRKLIATTAVCLMASLMTSCGDLVTNLTLFAGQKRDLVNGSLAQSRYSIPVGLASDGNNNLYVSDASSHTIRRISSTGQVTTIAGQPHVTGATDGNGQAATFNRPSAIVVDRNTQTLYVVDAANAVIRRVSATGDVTTLAGQVGQSGYQDGSATEALFNFEENAVSIAIDSVGNLYLAVTGQHVIRRITPAGDVSTFAGTRGTAGANDGALATATFSSPQRLAIDSNDNIFVTDSNGVRKITPAGEVSTFLPNTAEPNLSAVNALTVDSANNIYALESAGATTKLKKVTPAGEVSTLYAPPVSASGVLLNANTLMVGLSLATDNAGNVYLSDVGNAVIRKFSPAGAMSVYAGKTLMGATNSSAGANAQFAAPMGMAMDASGIIILTDSMNNSIRRVSTTGAVTTRAGVSSPANMGLVDGVSADARFNQPSVIVYNAVQKNYYIVDQVGKVLRKMSGVGTTSTFAGSTVSASSPYIVDGQGVNAAFKSMNAAVMSASNNLIYVVDEQTVRKVDMSGVVTTLAGQEGIKTYQDGQGTQATFKAPSYIVADSTGNAYVVDSGALRKITPAGQVSTVFGQYTDLNSVPSGTPLLVAVMDIDAQGYFYVQYCSSGVQFVTTSLSCDIRKLDLSSGTVTPTGVTANTQITSFKFDMAGQAFALIENALYKATLN